MTYNDFTEDMRNAITSAVKTSLLKLGIDADVALSSKIIYDGRELVHVETSPFNTTPVIYKSVIVKGDAFIEPAGEGVYEMAFSLDYRFKYFSGAENGVEIGTMRFRIFEKTMNIFCLGLTV